MHLYSTVDTPVGVKYKGKGKQKLTGGNEGGKKGGSEQKRHRQERK